jgi:hypothetical protein
VLTGVPGCARLCHMDGPEEMALRREFTRRIREALAEYSLNIGTCVSCTPWGDNTAYRIEVEFLYPNERNS